MLFRASAPGSLMLLGEYAVLYRKPALVCAVEKRITVCIQPRRDKQIIISSNGYEPWIMTIPRLAITPPFRFVTACLFQYRKRLPAGCDIEIHSEFSDQIGLGSSAAVTVATVAALSSWLGVENNALSLLREARFIIRQVQGVGSGADVAASVLGGVVAYRATPLSAQKFSISLPLTVVYSGSKTPTVEVIRRVEQRFSSSPFLFKSLCSSIQECVEEGILSLQEQNGERLGRAMNVQQGLMHALGVSTPLLDYLIEQLRANPIVMGAKISGSGLGDCVIGLGEVGEFKVEEKQSGVKQIRVTVAEEGVQ